MFASKAIASADGTGFGSTDGLSIAGEVITAMRREWGRTAALWITRRRAGTTELLLRS